MLKFKLTLTRRIKRAGKEIAPAGHVVGELSVSGAGHLSPAEIFEALRRGDIQTDATEATPAATPAAPTTPAKTKS